MYQRKRGPKASGPWCRELAAHSPDGEGSAFRSGKKVTRNGSRKKKSWAENVEEHDNGGSCKRVMVVVDQTKESKLALKWALSHVVQQLDVLTLLHVQPSVTPKQTNSHGSFFSAKAAEEVRRKNEVVGWEIANSFKTLIASSRPEVEVEILVVEGEKGPTIVAQTKKLEVSILVLGQKKHSVIWRFVLENSTSPLARLSVVPDHTRNQIEASVHEGAEYRSIDLEEKCGSNSLCGYEDVSRLLKKKSESLAEYCINNTDCLTLAVRKKRRLGGYLINSQWQKDFWLLA